MRMHTRCNAPRTVMHHSLKCITMRWLVQCIIVMHHAAHNGHAQAHVDGLSPGLGGRVEEELAATQDHLAVLVIIAVRVAVHAPYLPHSQLAPQSILAMCCMPLTRERALSTRPLTVLLGVRRGDPSLLYKPAALNCTCNHKENIGRIGAADPSRRGFGVARCKAPGRGSAVGIGWRDAASGCWRQRGVVGAR